MSPRRLRSQTLALIAAGALGLGAAACGDDEDEGGTGAATQQEEPAPVQPEEDISQGASPEAPTDIVGGQTILSLDSTTANVLETAGVQIEPVGNAEQSATGLAFPITTGQLDIDTLSGQVEHEGGLRFSVAGQSLEATDFVLRPEENRLTAEVAGQRVPLLRVDLGDPDVPQTGDNVVIPGTASTLTPAAAGALNEQLGVDIFEQGLRLGEITVSAQRP